MEFMPRITSIKIHMVLDIGNLNTLLSLFLLFACIFLLQRTQRF